MGRSSTLTTAAMAPCCSCRTKGTKGTCQILCSCRQLHRGLSLSTNTVIDHAVRTFTCMLASKHCPPLFCTFHCAVADEHRIALWHIAAWTQVCPWASTVVGPVRMPFDREPGCMRVVIAQTVLSDVFWCRRAPSLLTLYFCCVRAGLPAERHKDTWLAQ